MRIITGDRRMFQLISFLYTFSILEFYVSSKRPIKGVLTANASVSGQAKESACSIKCKRPWHFHFQMLCVPIRKWAHHIWKCLRFLFLCQIKNISALFNHLFCVLLFGIFEFICKYSLAALGKGSFRFLLISFLVSLIVRFTKQMIRNDWNKQMNENPKLVQILYFFASLFFDPFI